MKKQIFTFILILFLTQLNAQITFEKGYFIGNLGERTECFIKNLDWKNNPSEFEYKLTETDNARKVTMQSVSEFCIYEQSKYIRANVKIERSNNTLSKMSTVEEPQFIMEELFLKVLVEGKSNLYYYADKRLHFYFYKDLKGEIIPLISKKYKVRDGSVRVNNKFRDQIRTDLFCSSIDVNRVRTLDYRKGDLVKYFLDYSQCHQVEPIKYEPKKKRDFIKFAIRPRVNHSSLSINNIFSDLLDTDFGNMTGFGLGIETEIVLPYNKNKWALTIEPTYQSFFAEDSTEKDFGSGGVFDAKVTYQSIEVPLSIRHYFFLNPNSKLYLNASFVLDFTGKSKITFDRNGEFWSVLDIGVTSNFAIGVGYYLNDKFNVELRYFTNRSALSNYFSWKTDYKVASLIFGYRFFKTGSKSTS